ncbi:MAG: dipeptidase [Armatimonadota bacterium]|nr:dipeptidase [Armatimonadota bacterium]MDR7439953.1 dipeptidase [Armatimonadota bacterium]MDR7562382.1 dipeptidase [Armatimonadota bacterium]MDR7567071.1 dipeptidase [Armatimonadota bacterium]MDR7601536.1 dipeptidase [Armatimonadota bacterium]
MDRALAYARQHRGRFLEELGEWLRIPSISALPEHDADCERAAHWLGDRLRRMGMRTEIIPSVRHHPLVYAERLGVPDAPTVLVYGHYDVQPADPLEMWDSPPFEPTVRGDRLYARGASDDKGQVFAVVAALEALLATDGLPVNVKLLVEGEEESSGVEVSAYVARHRRKLHSDCALVMDSAFFDRGIPAITVGLRGILYAEVTWQGPEGDLHSGLFGGPAPNPFHEATRLLGGIWDRRGRVRIPRFYRGVQLPDEEERRSWQELKFDEATFARRIGARGVVGEEGFSVLERLWARPTFEIHGLSGGFTGPGAKTVLPARCTAKVSMRLVPDQDPERIYRAFERYILRRTHPAYRVEIRKLYAGRPWRISPQEPAVQAAARAWREAYGAEVRFIRQGGSVPVVELLARTLKLPVVVTGFGLPDDNLHAPNEKVELPLLWGGVEGVIRFFHHIAQTLRPAAQPPGIF